MIRFEGKHPYEAVTRFVLKWLGCLVRADYVSADSLIDEFEGESRIGDYLSIEDDDGVMQAVDPIDTEWWQMCFNQTHSSDDAVLLEVLVPLARDYRPMNACFVLVPVADGYRVVFQYCKPT